MIIGIMERAGAKLLPVTGDGCVAEELATLMQSGAGEHFDFHLGQSGILHPDFSGSSPG